MHDTTVLLFTRDRTSGRRLEGYLRAAGCAVLREASTAAAVRALGGGTVDLAVVDHGAGDDAIAVIDACDGVPCVVTTWACDPATLRELVHARGVANVLCGDDSGGPIRDLDARQIAVSAQKILSGDLFGIEKYTGVYGATISRIDVTDAAMRDDVVGAVRARAASIGCGRELSNRIATVTDELVTNAVYNAPRDERGHARYATTSRRHKISLDPWEQVQVRFASNGEVFAVSVTDWFGGLSRTHMRSVMGRCLAGGDQIEQKDGGAGLGLYTAFRFANQLVINTEPAERTEVIAVFELGAHMRGDRSAGHSLQMFTAAPDHVAYGSSPRNRTACPNTIEDAVRTLIPEGVRHDAGPDELWHYQAMTIQA